MSIKIEVEGGKSVRLKTAGKYCDRDIVVTAKGGASGENKLAQIIDRTVTEITAEDLAGVTKIGDNAFKSCNKLIHVSFPYETTIVGNGAFQDCTALENLPITNNVKEIGNNAFNKCQKITRIIIPDKVTRLTSSAFQYCINADTVIIGSGVTTIDGYAFADCRVLKSVTVKAEMPPKLSSSSFNNVPSDCAFYVPPASVEAYKAATNWSERADYIFPIVGEKGEVYTEFTIEYEQQDIYNTNPPLVVGETYYIEDAPFVAERHNEIADLIVPPWSLEFTSKIGVKCLCQRNPSSWYVSPVVGVDITGMTVTIYKAKE